MATTDTAIKIADDLRPVRSESSGYRPTRADVSSLAGGIFNTRSLSRASFDRRSDRTEFSHGDEEGDEWQHGHQKKKQVFKGRTLLLFVSPALDGLNGGNADNGSSLAYQSIGVIYGDIGTRSSHPLNS